MSKREPVAWMFKQDPWFDGNRWNETKGFTASEQVAKFKDPKAVPLYTAPTPLTDEQTAILKFLYGAAPLDGVWFGERHPRHKGQYWWRSVLRKAFETPTE